MAEIRMVDLTNNERIIDEMLGYWDRSTDYDRIRTAIKQRFGVGIGVETDPANPDQPYKLYTRKDFTTQIDAGLIESITIGWGQKIIAALATLFTEKGQRFELVSENEDADLSVELEYIDGIRDDGGFYSAIVDADRMSIGVGSSAIFPTFKNGGIEYQVLSPSDVRIYWPSAIIDADGKRRSPDYRDIEDAYAITIRLAEVDMNRHNYLAIFGRSEDFPNGRWVEYVSNGISTELPELNDENANEYEIDGAPANPLSYFANGDGKELNTPEYPIAIIKGVSNSRKTPFPVTTSLFEASLEFDTAASHISGKASSAAAGLTVVKLDDQGVSVPLPDTLEGCTTSLPGQEIEHISKNAADVETAYRTHKMEMIDAAAGYGVPDFMVASEDHTLDASSGIALQVKTRPLVKERVRRENVNKKSVARIFKIEKALLNLFSEDSEAAMLMPLTMQWSAGPLELPENNKEKADRIIALKEKGILDEIAAIREYYNFATDTEAIEMYERMKERQNEYPSLAPQPVKQTGLFRQSNLQQQNQQRNG